LVSTALLITACGSDDAETEAEAPADEASTSDDGYQIGVILDMTGPQASQGIANRQGLELALDQINADGGIDGRPINARIVDSESSPDRAAELARDLVGDDVVAIIGPSFTGTCSPVQPIIEQAGVMEYCLSGAPFEWTPHFFAAHAAPEVMLGEIPATWAEQEGLDSIACLATNDRSGDAYIGALEDATQGSNQSLNVVKYTSGDPSVETQLTSLRSEDPDLVYSCASGANLATVAQGMEALGLEQPLFAGLGSVSQPVAELVKDTLPPGGIYATGSWVNVPDAIPEDHPYRDEILAFAADYEEAYRAPLDSVGASAADGLLLVAEALRGGATTGTEIAQFIENIDRFEGIGASYTEFSSDNHRGARSDGLVMRFGPDGRFEFVEELELG
jgi:branched-chain amino acid transport system substrate-binding protein